MSIVKSLVVALACVLISQTITAQERNLARGKTATANSENQNFPAGNVVDGKITRNSKWMSADVRPPHILEIDLQKYCNVNRVVIYTGIPEKERTASESTQAAGFWSAKNFKIQYWDDANWTDLPNAEVHENRLTEVVFAFSTTINTYKMRLVCDDGEPISIMEFEIFGTETNRAAPVTTKILATKTKITDNQSIDIKVNNKEVGQTMKYVGYNQGYYMPGSNASGWIEYSGVNSVRVWLSLNSYVPLSTIQVDKTVASVVEFDKRKDELRADPEGNKFLKWSELYKIYNDTEKAANTNPMVLSYVISELTRLRIDPVIQAGSTDFNETWSNKWQQWQRYYALAYYLAKTGNITMIAMQNEPNHKNAGMKLGQWIGGMQIVSDAMSCAVADVNKKYGKKLTSQMVGPVTAGNNPEWWAGIAKAIRTDYHGKTTDHDLLKIFSTHSYNSPAAGYTNRVNDIRKVITDNHPHHTALPITYTEIGRWMNAYLIDKDETMDSPSLFTEWAGIYTNNTRNGAFGMWAFKFSNTSSDTYVKGVKSGHHFTWQGERLVEDAYPNLLAGKPVKTYNGSLAGMLTDGLKTEASAWTSDTLATEKWLEIELGTPQELGSAIVYTGSDGGVYTAPDRIRNFKLQYYDNGNWLDIPGTVTKDNKYAQLFMRFKRAVNVSKIRFVSTDPGFLKIREIKAYAAHSFPEPAEKNFDVSGIQRTGEVVRLFAKGFKEQRPLFETTTNKNDENLDALTSYDAANNRYYMWLVQRGNYRDDLEIDLSALKLKNITPITGETVSTDRYGEVTGQYKLNSTGKLKLALPPQSVTLLTIPTGNSKVKRLGPVADGTVSGGTMAAQNYGSMETLNVSLDASSPNNNQVSFVEFKETSARPYSLGLLKVTGSVKNGQSPMRIHVYALPQTSINEKTLNWNNAPQLDKNEALVKGVGTKAVVIGELVFDGSVKEHALDVTRFMNEHVLTSGSITFILVRETREMGDDADKGKTVSISSKEGSAAPVLELWNN